MIAIAIFFAGLVLRHSLKQLLRGDQSPTMLRHVRLAGPHGRAKMITADVIGLMNASLIPILYQPADWLTHLGISESRAA